ALFMHVAYKGIIDGDVFGKPCFGEECRGGSGLFEYGTGNGLSARHDDNVTAVKSLRVQPHIVAARLFGEPVVLYVALSDKYGEPFRLVLVRLADRFFAALSVVPDI